MLKRLPEALRHQDPLIAGAESLAERTGRFSLNGHEIADWLIPLFPEATEADKRRTLAACLLSDIGWNEHPDYRAEHAFYRCLRLPYAGLSHADRVSIAAMVYVRYNGNSSAPLVTTVRSLLAEDQLSKAQYRKVPGKPHPEEAAGRLEGWVWPPLLGRRFFGDGDAVAGQLKADFALPKPQRIFAEDRQPPAFERRHVGVFAERSNEFHIGGVGNQLGGNVRFGALHFQQHLE